MRPLRITAIASNIAFMIYALGMHLQPKIVLHSILLPLNVFRLAQIELALRTRQRRSHSGAEHLAPQRRAWLSERRLPP